jgi:hypothetical protein
MKKTMMIIGLGTVGFHSLELLTQSPEFSRGHRIIACSLNEAKGLQRVNTIRALAQGRGLFPSITFQKMDLQKILETSESLEKYAPDLIFASSTLLRRQILDDLPSEIASRIHEAGLGPLVPCHLNLIHKLMLSIEEAGIDPIVINASIPDITGPILHRRGIGFEAGIGNIANYAPRLRDIIGRKLKIHPQKVKLYWYMHHSGIANIAATGTTGGVPYILRIYVENKDVTDLFDTSGETMKTEDVGWPALLKASDANYNHITAMSAYRTILSIWNDDGDIFYTPSPKGLPGGYTVVLDSEGADLVLPEGVSLGDVKEVNEIGSRFDGVERIENDGTLVLTEKAHLIVRESLGLDFKTARIDNYEKIANELLLRFKELAKNQSSERARA